MLTKSLSNKLYNLRKVYVFPAVLSLILLILYFCPIFYLTSGEHSGYYNAFHCLSNENVWILIVSIVSFIGTISFSIYDLLVKERNKNIIIISVIIYIITIIFCILTFIFAANTTNLPK